MIGFASISFPPDLDLLRRGLLDYAISFSAREDQLGSPPCIWIRVLADVSMVLHIDGAIVALISLLFGVAMKIYL